MLSGALVASLLMTSVSAMMKVFMVIIVGVVIAQYPKDSPYLPSVSLKYMSRLSNNVFLPCLIINALGSSLTPQSLSMMSILILFSIINTLFSYILAITLGRYLNKDNAASYHSVVVAVSAPNAISLPIMVMATLCEQPIVNRDFNNDVAQCQVEATSMLFVYSVGWHFLYWSFFFPELQRIKREIIDSCPIPDGQTLSRTEVVVSYLKDWVQRVALSGVMIAIMLGVVIGSWPALQSALFKDMSFLRPVGSMVSTLGEPVVALNSVIMAASLASVPREELIEQLERVVRPFSWLLACFGLCSSSMKSGVEAETGAASSNNATTADVKYSEVAMTNSIDNASANKGSEPFGGAMSNPIREDWDEDRDRFGAANSDIEEHSNRLRAHSEDCNYDIKSKLSDNTGRDGTTVSPSLACVPNSSAKLNNGGGNDRIISSNFNNGKKPEKSTFVTSESSAESSTTPSFKQSHPKYHSDRLILIHSLCRLIIPPIFIISLVSLMYPSKSYALSADAGFYRLLQLVLVVESGSPSAQVVMVCLQQLEVPYLATRLSYMYIYHYIFAIVTITISTSVIMSMVYY